MRNLWHYHAEWSPEYDLKDMMKKWEAPVDYRHENAMEDFFRSRIVLKPERQKSKVSPWWRLTLPGFLLLWPILLLIVCPINWIITGHYGLSATNKIGIWLKPWINKLFP